TLYAGTAKGISKSVDGGAHWTDLLPGSPVSQLTIKPRISGSVLAVTDAGYLFSTEDGGTHWQFIGQNLAASNSVAPTQTVQISARDNIDVSLAPPQLLAPAEGTVFDNFPRQITVRWQPSPKASSYLVEWDYSS